MWKLVAPGIGLVDFLTPARLTLIFASNPMNFYTEFG